MTRVHYFIGPVPDFGLLMFPRTLKTENTLEAPRSGLVANWAGSSGLVLWGTHDSCPPHACEITSLTRRKA